MNLITNLLKFEKMKKTMTFLIAFLMLGAVGFSQKTIKTYFDPLTQKKIKESYTVNSQGLKNGLWKLWNEDGILMSEYNFSNGKKNGKCVDYYEFGEAGGRTIGVSCAGQAMSIETYANDEPTGTHTYYTCKNNSQLILKEKVVYSSGKYVQTFYYPNGKKKAEINGLRRNHRNCMNGAYTAYYENGKVRTKGEYKDKGGNYESVKFGKWIHYYEDGKILGEENYDEWGNPLGKFVELDINGNIIADGEFVKDPKSSENKFSGKLSGYYTNGTKSFEVEVKLVKTSDKNRVNSPDMLGLIEKQINGKVTTWKDNGEKDMQREYLDGSIIKEWYPNGQIKEETDFSANPVTYKTFSEDGQLLIKAFIFYDPKLKSDNMYNGYYLGEYEEHYENGNLKINGQYDTKQPYSQIGEWKEYAENGDLNQVIVYDSKGNKIKTKSPEELRKEGMVPVNSVFANKYNSFLDICLSQKPGMLSTPESPVYVNDYPYGKVFFQKCSELIDYYNSMFLQETDAIKKEDIKKSFEATISKIIEITKSDTKAIEKELKKAKTPEEIKTILGL